jgi:hypothetical protein
MRKIVSLFARNFDTAVDDRKVRNEVMPAAQWVADGEGVATRKWDGMAVLVKDGAVFKRHDAKNGKTPPPDFVPAQPEPDPVSKHWPGWVPVGKGDRPVNESMAWARANMFPDGVVADGAYEAVGPLIGTRHGKNPENLTEQRLVVHGSNLLPDAPRDYDGLMAYRAAPAVRRRSEAARLCPSTRYDGLPKIEGIVWHHPDGRMAKIKKMDFPYARESALSM